MYIYTCSFLSVNISFFGMHESVEATISVKSISRTTGVNSENGIVDRHYWRRHSLTIIEPFVRRKVDYMKAHDYNSTGHVHEIAVQFVREGRICHSNLPSLSLISEPLQIYISATLQYTFSHHIYFFTIFTIGQAKQIADDIILTRYIGSAACDSSESLNNCFNGIH